jgi:hypothetical protein
MLRHRPDALAAVEQRAGVEVPQGVGAIGPSHRHPGLAQGRLPDLGIEVVAPDQKADPTGLDTVEELRAEAVAWLASKGLDQWQPGQPRVAT